jgi:putative tryptophan/tyrosine transport system substrate-binding protein
VKRRDFITLLGGAVAGWPLAARGQQGGRVYRIGLLRVGPPPPSFIEPLRRALSELGHVEGKISSSTSELPSAPTSSPTSRPI